MRVLRMIVICLLSFCSISCFPEFKEGLPQKAVSLNSSIAGVWLRETRNDKQMFLVFSRNAMWYDVVFLYGIDSKSSTDGINVLTFEGYISEVNNDLYFCFRPREKDSNSTAKERAFLLMNFAAGSDNLVLRPLSNEVIVDLVNQGALQGRITEDQILGNQNIVVTSSAKEIETVFGQFKVVDMSDSKAMSFRRGQLKDADAFFMRATEKKATDREPLT